MKRRKTEDRSQLKLKRIKNSIKDLIEKAPLFAGPTVKNPAGGGIQGGARLQGRESLP